MAGVETNIAVEDQESRVLLFQKSALEELNYRYKRYEGIMLLEEKQAMQQVMEKFQNGLYISITLTQSIGTFYSPVSLVFTLLRFGCRLLFPATQSWMRWVGFVPRRQNLRLIFFCLFILFDIIIMLVVYPLLLIIELVLILCSFIFCYGLFMLYKYGMFVYSFKVYLVTDARNQRNFTTPFQFTEKVLAANVSITRAPLKRILCTQPVAKMFKDMNITSDLWLDQLDAGNSAGDVQTASLATQSPASSS